MLGSPEAQSWDRNALWFLTTILFTLALVLFLRHGLLKKPILIGQLQQAQAKAGKCLQEAKSYRARTRCLTKYQPTIKKLKRKLKEIQSK